MLEAEKIRFKPITAEEVMQNPERFAAYLNHTRWLVEEFQYESGDTAERMLDALNLIRIGGEDVMMAFWEVELPTA